MRIFYIMYIDWQQHWKYDRTMNIGANAHGKTSGINKTATSDRLETSVDSWASSDIGEVLSLFYKSLDCFTMRLFHSATIFCCYICTCICCLKLHQAAWLPGWRGLFQKLNSVGGTQLQCIYYLCRILISRPPRVFRRFKRRSCRLLNEESHTVCSVKTDPTIRSGYITQSNVTPYCM